MRERATPTDTHVTFVEERDDAFGATQPAELPYEPNAGNAFYAYEL